MADIMLGAKVAEALVEESKEKVNNLRSRGINSTLAIVRVGAREDDLSYERGATKRMEKMDIDIKKYEYPVDISQQEFETEFERINADDSIHGILMFRPLPKTLDEKRIVEMINPLKDVDCMSSASLAKVFMGDESGYGPCTAEAVIHLLDHYGVDVCGKNVVVIGRSLVIGKPVAMMLLKKNATVTICHTKTKDMEKIVSKADIVVACAGVAKMVKPDMLKDGAIVADVGINMDEEGNLCGDVDFDACQEKCSLISPVPRGIGSITTTVLGMHVLKAAEVINAD